MLLSVNLAVSLYDEPNVSKPLHVEKSKALCSRDFIAFVELLISLSLLLPFHVLF